MHVIYLCHTYFCVSVCEGPKGFSVIHLSPWLSGEERGTQES